MIKTEISLRRSLSGKRNPLLVTPCMIRGCSTKLPDLGKVSVMRTTTTCLISPCSQIGLPPPFTKTSIERLGREPSLTNFPKEKRVMKLNKSFVKLPREALKVPPQTRRRRAATDQSPLSSKGTSLVKTMHLGKVKLGFRRDLVTSDLLNN